MSGSNRQRHGGRAVGRLPRVRPTGFQAEQSESRSGSRLLRWPWPDEVSRPYGGFPGDMRSIAPLLPILGRAKPRDHPSLAVSGAHGLVRDGLGSLRLRNEREPGEVSAAGRQLVQRPESCRVHRRARAEPCRHLRSWWRLGEAGLVTCRGAERRGGEQIFRESGHHSMPDPRAPGWSDNLSGWIGTERSERGDGSTRARVTRAPLTVASVNPSERRGPAPLGARASVRHRARGGGVREWKA